MPGAGAVTLKVVSDNTVELPVRNLMDIPSMARGFAEDLESDEYGEVTRVIVVLDSPDGLRTLQWGENISIYEAMGMLDAAKITSFDMLFNEE
jgi:hypothetical protein